MLCSEYSKTLNDARLKVLAARETAIQSVVKEARAHVRNLARNPSTYKKLLQDLLVQVRAGFVDGVKVCCWANTTGPADVADVMG